MGFAASVRAPMVRPVARVWRRFAPAAPHLIVLAAQALGLLFFAAPMRVIDGFPLDDAWIHQVVARTFAQTGTLGYTAGQHGGAATSCLWAVLLSANFEFFHRDPVVFTLALNVALSLAAGQLLLLCFRSADARGGDALRSTASVALACIGGNFLWFAFCGMEANLVIVLSLACIVAWTRVAGTRGAVLAGAAAGALALTRPECAAMAPVVVLWTRPLGRTRGDAAWLLGIWLACLAGYFGVNLATTGHAMPATLAGRRWLWRSVNPGLSWFALLLDYLSVVAFHLRDYTLGTSATPAFWVGLGLAVFAYVHLVKEHRSPVALVLAWTGVHFGTYALLLPTPGHGGRYVPLVPLVYLAGVAYGSVLLVETALRFFERTMAERWYRTAALTLGAGALAPWVGLVVVGVRDWRLDNVRATSHIRWTEEGMGPLVDALPAGAKVASFDIGGVGFRAHRPIVDLGGLSDAATAQYLRKGDLWRFLHDQHIDYVVIPIGFRERFPDITNFLYRLRLVENPALTLEPIGYRESPFETWMSGMQATWNSSPRQELYRLHWTGAAGPNPVSSGTTHAVGDPDGLLTRRGRAQIGAALGMLSSEGAPLDLTVSDSPPATADRGDLDVWRVTMGPWGLAVDSPGKDEALRGYVRATLADWVEPYLLAGDFDGASLAAVHAFALAWRAKKDHGFYPILPPVAAPSPGGTVWPMTASAPWGIPLAAVCAVLGMGLERLRRRGRASAAGTKAGAAVDVGGAALREAT